MKKIALFLVSLLCPTMVFATTVTATTAAMPNVTPTPTAVQYELPYPGMLPNNPLYFLKPARDWILDKLIMDPVKKTEFYILQGDKRLAMGIQLSAGGSGVLAEQTISKGEKYMNNAEQTLFALKAQGTEVPAYVTDHLAQSLAKHEEVLTSEIQVTSDATIKSGLSGSLDLVHTLQAGLQKLK
jgi:hypothetical protein